MLFRSGVSVMENAAIGIRHADYSTTMSQVIGILHARRAVGGGDYHVGLKSLASESLALPEGTVPRRVGIIRNHSPILMPSGGTPQPPLGMASLNISLFQDADLATRQHQNLRFEINIVDHLLQRRLD